MMAGLLKPDAGGENCTLPIAHGYSLPFLVAEVGLSTIPLALQWKGSSVYLLFFLQEIVFLSSVNAAQSLCLLASGLAKNSREFFVGIYFTSVGFSCLYC